MEVKGYSPYVFRISCGYADIPYGVFIDLIDCHVKADVFRSCRSNIFHDVIVSIAPDFVMTFLVSVQTEQDQICFGQLQWKGSVGYHIHDEKTHMLCLNHEIAQGFVSVFPEKGFSAAEKQNPDSHIIELPHLCSDLRVWMENRCNVIDRTMFALQIALIGNDDRSQDGILFPEKDGFYAKSGKMEK